MLDSKYKSAYNSIKAPEDMLSGITNKANKKRTFNFKKLIPIAACVLLMAAILPAYMGITSPSVSVSSQPVAASARIMETSVLITVETHRDTEISVSYGEISIPENEKVNGTTELIWSFDSFKEKMPIMILKDKFGTRSYELSNDENNGGWTIVKK